MKPTGLQPEPYMSNDEPARVLFLGALVAIRARTEQTGGSFNLFDVICPVDFATPLHIHYMEDVAVYVLEGALTFFWGREGREAPAGSYYYQPRGIPHGFRVAGTTPARILYLTLPAGLDRFISKQGQPAPACESVTAAARYKIEILGPLPG